MSTSSCFWLPSGSASIGGWGEGAVLLFLFSLSGALESYAEGRTEREINSLFKSSPKTARVLRSGIEETVPIELIVPGLLLLIKPGDLVPVDCELVKGQTACDESTLTGESAPVEKTIADQLYSGTINLWGAVEVKALRPASQSALSRVIEIIREAQHQKAPAQKFTDRFSSRYTYGVLAAAFVMFFVWWLGLKYPPFKAATGQSAFYRTMTLLVVSSPCALVLSIPSAVLSAIAYGAKRGILFRGGSAVERLADVNVVVMDKTGTVTTGDLKVNGVESLPPGREDAVLALALSVEELSTHPLARAITSFARQRGLGAVPLTQFESVAGAGLRALADGKPLRLGKREWVLEGGATPPNLISGSGLTEVWLRSDGLIGRITLQDEFRENARELIDDLHRLNLKTVLLTGDRVETAERARTQLGIQEVKGGLKPEEKLLVIGALKRHGARVAMIGDGVNDAPSLAAADVGVAMGARGSDAALEQADVVLMNDQLENFVTALHLSKRAQRVIRQNLFVSLGTVAVLVFFALGGRIPLTVGVVGHEGSTVLVVLNSLRLLLQKKD
jgi:Cd2+/Zn2+-exporting ATPase